LVTSVNLEARDVGGDPEIVVADHLAPAFKSTWNGIVV
jgi:hypothetical protein